MPDSVVRDLSLSKKDTLKPIPKKLMDKFINLMLQNIAKQNDTTYSVMKTPEKTNIGIVYTKDSDKILHEINIYVAQNLTNFIEIETKESAKKYYRNLILFESSISDETLQLHWL